MSHLLLDNVMMINHWITWDWMYHTEWQKLSPEHEFEAVPPSLFSCFFLSFFVRLHPIRSCLERSRSRSGVDDISTTYPEHISISMIKPKSKRVFCTFVTIQDNEYVRAARSKIQKNRRLFG